MNELREERRRARVTQLPEGPFGAGKTLEVLAVGPIRLSVCTNADVKDVEAAANYVSPTGISSRWARLSDPTFATGQKNPSPCPDGNGCVHYLLGC